MAVTIKEVEHIAELAMLELSEEEKQTLKYQLSSILEWIRQLEEIDTSNVNPTSTVTRFKTSLRKDVPFKYQQTSAITANAPEREYDFFKVKKVIEDE